MPSAANRHHFRPVDGWGPSMRSPLVDRRPPMPDDAIYAGRGTPLGNPWMVPRDGTPGEVIQAYRRRLFNLIERNNAAAWRQLRSIGPNTLVVCSCSPARCHVDEIIKAWEWLRRTGAL